VLVADCAGLPADGREENAAAFAARAANIPVCCPQGRVSGPCYGRQRNRIAFPDEFEAFPQTSPLHRPTVPARAMTMNDITLSHGASPKERTPTRRYARQSQSAGSPFMPRRAGRSVWHALAAGGQRMFRPRSHPGWTATASLSGGPGLAGGDLVGWDQFEEVRIGNLLLAGNSCSRHGSVWRAGWALGSFASVDGTYASASRPWRGQAGVKSTGRSRRGRFLGGLPGFSGGRHDHGSTSGAPAPALAPVPASESRGR
jgi:hypothetical protein